MKYIYKFENFNLTGYQNKLVWAEDSNNIQKLLPNDINIYDEIVKLKQDCNNSILYNIIKNYFNLTDKNDIMRQSMKFIELNYSEILQKYKISVKSKDRKPNRTIIEIPYNDSTLKVPSKIGHNYTPINVLSLEDLEKYKEHRRLRVFYYKGLKCVSCPNIGEYLIAGKDKFGGIHIDLYTKDFKLMTIDHVKPRSKGGTDTLNNVVPMCAKCNSFKSDKYEENL